jgi:squalene-hopene/tetraprenyl-beta-curcumene cyclase
VWDTALAVIALVDAGLPAEHPALVRATDWLLDEEIRVQGDWAIRRPGLPPSGWAFEFANDNYPDIDDTAEVVLALRRVSQSHPDRQRVEEAIDRGVAWVLGMQSGDGGWGAFDADNTRTLCRELPFCDFGEVIDPPSADVTAHVVEMLASEGRAAERPARRGLSWLARSQEADGSWPVGGQPRVRHRGGRPGRRVRGYPAPGRKDPRGRPLARAAPEPGRGLG